MGSGEERSQFFVANSLDMRLRFSTLISRILLLIGQSLSNVKQICGTSPQLPISINFGKFSLFNAGVDYEM